MKGRMGRDVSTAASLGIQVLFSGVNPSGLDPFSISEGLLDFYGAFPSNFLE